MRLIRLTVLSSFILALLLQGCATVTTGDPVVEFDHSYDFGHVHKVAIQPIARDTVATMLISDQQISRINLALSRELTRRGFEVVADNSEADVYLNWRFIYDNDASLSPFDPGQQRSLSGTLTINMIDPEVLQSKWRVSYHSDLRDQPETPEAAQYRRKVAKLVLSQFPPP